MVPFETLNDLLRYNPDTGEIFWRVPRHGARVGRQAGSIEKYHGYRRIRVNYQSIHAHIIAFVLMTGEWPKLEIDHINGDRSDNRWANLREATKSQNRYNQRMHRDNCAGLKGVYARRGGYRACIKFNGRHIHLGDFPDKYQAHAAYVAAAEKYFGEFARAA